MRDAVRRLFVRPQPPIVQVRVPSIIAGRRGLPVLLSAFAVLAAASTAATTTVSADGAVAAPAGTTVLPPAAPPTYAYPGSSPGGATAPGGTGLNGGTSGGTASSQLAANGIPARAAQAYQQAAVAAACGIPWTLLAAIGRVESDHGRFSGATLLSDGRSDPPVVGIPLDGRPGVAVIKDTDGGRWDADRTYDRAVGPMQFIPSSWATFGVDGDSDGKADPFDIDDAAAAAARYLCKAGGGNLSSEVAQRNAVYSYNRSTAYVDNVMALAAVYAGGAPVDNAPAPNGTPRPPIAQPTLPPATVGDPPAAAGTTTRTPTPSTSKPGTPTPTSHPTGPSSQVPTTTPPSSPSPTTPAPSSPAPTTTSPSPSPTCTPSPSPSPTPSSSGTNTPNGVPSAESTPTGTASAAATGTGSADASGTPTPTPSPTLPPCPS